MNFWDFGFWYFGLSRSPLNRFMVKANRCCARNCEATCIITIFLRERVLCLVLCLKKSNQSYKTRVPITWKTRFIPESNIYRRNFTETGWFNRERYESCTYNHQLESSEYPNKKSKFIISKVYSKQQHW